MSSKDYYILQPLLDGKTVRMAKFVDDMPKSDSVYEVTKTSCQCWQAARQCRHMKMWIEWDRRGRGAMVVDYERNIYLPHEAA